MQTHRGPKALLPTLLRSLGTLPISVEAVQEKVSNMVATCLCFTDCDPQSRFDEYMSDQTCRSKVLINSSCLTYEMIPD